jgi:hypothetical protein
METPPPRSLLTDHLYTAKQNNAQCSSPCPAIPTNLIITRNQLEVHTMASLVLLLSHKTQKLVQ